MIADAADSIFRQGEETLKKCSAQMGPSYGSDDYPMITRGLNASSG